MVRGYWFNGCWVLGVECVVGKWGRGEDNAFGIGLTRYGY